MDAMQNEENILIFTCAVSTIIWEASELTFRLGDNKIRLIKWNTQLIYLGKNIFQHYANDMHLDLQVIPNFTGVELIKFYLASPECWIRIIIIQ